MESSKGKGIRMVAGAYYIPKKRPGSTTDQGEDAYFLCEEKEAIGVADGVGSWILQGVDSGEYARQLMNNPFEAILSMEPDDGNVDDRIMKRVLDQAFSNTKAKGSSTACIIKLIDNIFTIEIESGDILVVGTDGLFDNMFDKEIRDVVKMAAEAGCNPWQVAWAVVEHAYDKSMNRTAYTPFMQASLASRRRFLGGKVDDITVIVANIVDS
ncbi:probable protein phosphatase 2C 80 [Juglans microcarpa x Juglans regia]|uniref:probable protein phosphatase 2C 80 n=1 Tax=Juglans microcarpa x Juglans regia TaxID=2249226 RepID=UPI001B7E49B6|nr:probable protein phosphatase 2C 80 [Juglans microcarpa x Juglans regia]